MSLKQNQDLENGEFFFFLCLSYCRKYLLNHFLFSQINLRVMNQRRHYKLFMENKKSPLTLEKIRMFEAVGFKWSIKQMSVSQRVPWEQRYQELIKFFLEFNHVNVPRDGKYKCLRNWVDTQRRQNALLQQNKHSHLTPERRVLLDFIGFPWHIRERSSRQNITFTS